MTELKQIQKENDKLKQKLVSSDFDDLIKQAKTLKGINIVTGLFEGVDSQVLRNLGDRVIQTLETGFVVLASKEEDKVTFIAMASEEAIKKGAHAGNTIREVAKIAGGGGGGRPNMAQAGGKLPEKAEEALKKVYVLFE